MFPCFSSLDLVTDIFSNFFNGFLRWFNKKLTIVLSEIPSQKVKASINMGYYCFLIRQFKTSIFQEVFDQFFNFFSYFLCFCSNNKIICISRKVNFIFCSMMVIYLTTLFVVFICKQFLNPVQCHIRQNWWDYTTLWSSCFSLK